MFSSVIVPTTLLLLAQSAHMALLTRFADYCVWRRKGRYKPQVIQTPPPGPTVIDRFVPVWTFSNGRSEEAGR